MFKTTKLYKFITILTLVLSVTFVFNKFPLVKEIAIGHIERWATSFQREAKTLINSSTSIRVELLKVGLETLGSTYGLGSGIGNITNVATPNRLYATSGIDTIHNYTIEVLMTEGVIGFALYVLIVFSLLIPIITSRNRSSVLQILSIKTLSVAEMKVLMFLIFFIVGTTVPSGINGINLYWAMLAYYYIIISMDTKSPGKIEQINS